MIMRQSCRRISAAAHAGIVDGWQLHHRHAAGAGATATRAAPSRSRRASPPGTRLRVRRLRHEARARRAQHETVDEIAVAAPQQLRDRAAHRVADRDDRAGAELDERRRAVVGAVGEAEDPSRRAGPGAWPRRSGATTLKCSRERLERLEPVEAGAGDPAVQQEQRRRARRAGDLADEGGARGRGARRAGRRAGVGRKRRCSAAARPMPSPGCSLPCRSARRSMLTHSSASERPSLSRRRWPSDPFGPEAVDPVGDFDRLAASDGRDGSPGRSRTSSSTASRSGSGSTATWLTDATRWTTPSGVIVCTWRNSAVVQLAEAGHRRVRAVAPVLVVAPRRALLDAVHDRPHLVDPRLGAVARVPHEAEPAARAQHARQLRRSRARGRTSATPARR